MNETFTAVVLNLNKFLTIDFNKQTLHKKMKFSIQNFFNKCDQIRRFLWIWSHLLKKSSTENFIFCAVKNPQHVCLENVVPRLFNLQERRNISKLYMIARGHLFPVYALGNECAQRYFLQEKDVLTETSLGRNKVSGCHTKPKWTTFLPT